MVKYIVCLHATANSLFIPLPLTLYMLTYFFVLKGNKDHHQSCQLATGAGSAEIPRKPQHHPGSGRQAVGSAISTHCSGGMPETAPLLRVAS